MIVSHPVTQFNQGGPCRPSPTPPIHPKLSGVKTLRESLTQGIISVTNGDSSHGSIKGEKEFLRLIESNISSQPASERAVCVPDYSDTPVFVPVRDTLAEIRPVQHKTVRIPAAAQHEGFYFKNVTVDWICPVCGGPRGEPYDTVSYDGSRRLSVHGWRNPCGHVDKYDDVRKEAEKADAFARLQAATDAWLADPTPANKNAMIDANMKWHKMGGSNG